MENFPLLGISFGKSQNLSVFYSLFNGTIFHSSTFRPLDRGGGAWGLHSVTLKKLLNKRVEHTLKLFYFSKMASLFSKVENFPFFF